MLRKLSTLLLLFHGVVHANSLLSVPEPILLPKIENKTPITLVAEKGFWTEYLNQNIIAEFTKATGVEVKVHSASLGDMYQLQTDSMKNGYGQFDVVTIEAGWAKEWAANGYTVPIYELIREYDPNAASDISDFSDNYYPAILSLLSYKGDLHSLPYNSYVMGNHYRKDLFEHEEEKEQFLAQYGYSLQAPVTFKQLKDTAEFFTRKKGERMAGNILEEDFYGVALMSGNRPHINDELSSILWGMGGKWFVPDFNGPTITGFHVRSESETAIAAANYYLELMEYALPANDQFAFLESANALNSGKVAMSPFQYNNLWSISGLVNQKVENGKLGISPVAGGRPYHGAYSFAVSYDSQNPEAAYWLMRYVSSFENQLAYAQGGGNPCRLDVVRYLIDTLPAGAPQRQALESSFQSDSNWKRDIHLYGHYTSTAMGSIYPMLMKAAYRIAIGSDIENTLKALSVQIITLQNLYGEEAMLAE